MAKRKSIKTAEAADIEDLKSSQSNEVVAETKEGVENVAEPKQKKKGSKKQIVVSARRKMAIARATIKPGKGIIRINKMALDSIENPYVKTLITEPLKIGNDYVSSVDIEVNVSGGGQMGQAQAVRSAIAKALVAYTKDSQLKKEMLAYDRFMLVDDVRQVEPKKFKGRKARARFQKSYR